MSEEQKKILEQQLWNIANALRGKMDADEFRDYILGFIFYKYLSEKIVDYANELLDIEVNSRNSSFEISYDKPDPLLVARRYDDEFIILLCALFAYGNAKLIVKFLDSLNFSLLNESEEKIEKELKNHYYRFQNSADVIAIFKTFRRMKQENSLQNLFYEAYKKENSILEGIDTLIQKIFKVANYNSQGFTFLVQVH